MSQQLLLLYLNHQSLTVKGGVCFVTRTWKPLSHRIEGLVSDLLASEVLRKHS